MLYFLLIIIAIGVLLASEAGQVFLGLLVRLGFVGLLLCLVILVVLAPIVLLTTDTGKAFAIGVLCLIPVVIIWAWLKWGWDHLIKVIKDRGGLDEICANIIKALYNNRIYWIIFITIIIILAFYSRA